MNARKWIALILLSIAALAPSAHAGPLTFSLVGAAADSKNPPASGKFVIGAGALLDLHFTPRVALESGGVYLANVDYIQIPALLRFRILRGFSIAGGMYDKVYTESGHGSDYGWMAGVRLALGFRWFLDADYSRGLKDQGGSNYDSSILGLLGYRF